MGEYKIKQTIVVRGDLNFGSKGKLIAQCCHASLGVILDYLQRSDTVDLLKDGPFYTYTGKMPIVISQWIEGDFAKVVLKAPGLDDLLKLEKICKEDNIPYKLITDNGTTVFHESTITCIAIGPFYSTAIESFTKDYKLL